MSKFSLQGKTAIITGGAGGLGRAMIAAYAEAGANVVVASRNVDNIEAEAEKIRAKKQSAIAIPVDVTDAEQVDALVAKTVEAFGALDVMVNNAGRWGRSHQAEDTPLDEWRNLVEQNLTGVFITCMAAGRQMIKQQGGKIINIASPIFVIVSVEEAGDTINNCLIAIPHLLQFCNFISNVSASTIVRIVLQIERCVVIQIAKEITEIVFRSYDIAFSSSSPSL